MSAQKASRQATCKCENIKKCCDRIRFDTNASRPRRSGNRNDEREDAESALSNTSNRFAHHKSASKFAFRGTAASRPSVRSEQRNSCGSAKLENEALLLISLGERRATDANWTVSTTGRFGLRSPVLPNASIFRRAAHTDRNTEGSVSTRPLRAADTSQRTRAQLSERELTSIQH